MKKSGLITIVLGLFIVVSGCNQQPVPEAKQQAYNRWYRLRADMLCNIAGEHLKVGLLEKAEKKTREALAMDDKFATGYILLGKIYIEQGKYVMAAEQLEHACRLEPQSQEAFYLLAVAQEKNNHPEEAIGNYKHAYNLDISNIEPIKAIVEILVSTGKLRQGRMYLENYLSRAQDDPGMYELAGRIAMMTLRYDQAAEYFLQACDLDTKNHRYREKLARAYFLAENYQQAHQTLEILIAREKYQPPAWVHVMFGEVLLTVDKPFQARQAYHKAEKMNTASGDVWASIAKADLAVGDTERAIHAARRALVLDRKNINATMLLGYSLLRHGQKQQAIEHLGRAVKQHPNNAMLWCLLGRAWSASGDTAQALRCYNTALTLESDNRLARVLVDSVGQ